MQNPVDIREFENLASKILSSQTFNYFAGGAGDEITLTNNVTAYDQIKLNYRVLRNTVQCSLATTVLGHAVSLPILAAPTAFQKLAHPEGEIATAKATNNHQTIMVVSTYSTSSLKDIATNTGTPPWFQIYIYKNREVTHRLIKLAEDCEYSAIVLTVDTPFYAKRLRELQSPLQLPNELEFENLAEAGLDLSTISPSEKPQYLASLLDPSITWKDVEWLRSITHLPIILKGIIHPEDAILAVQHGASGLIVSNHGGRQLDTAPATIEALPSIIRAVEKKIEVFVDGGIRKGIDILKALAIGAQAVLIGRPILWGLSVNGEEGVFQVLNLLREELALAMALSGYTSIDQISQEVLYCDNFKLRS